MSDDIRKLGRLIQDVKVAMMTTVHDDGVLHSRPMIPLERDFDGELWFFTSMRSVKVHELERNRQVNLSFAAPEDNRYVSISGTAEALQDREKAAQLWNPLHRAWFPKGVEDPDLGLLRVHVEKAEYWDSASSIMVQLAGFGKAMVSGKRYETGPDEHDGVKL